MKDDNADICIYDRLKLILYPQKLPCVWQKYPALVIHLLRYYPNLLDTSNPPKSYPLFNSISNFNHPSLFHGSSFLIFCSHGHSSVPSHLRFILALSFPTLPLFQTILHKKVRSSKQSQNIYGGSRIPCYASIRGHFSIWVQSLKNCVLNRRQTTSAAAVWRSQTLRWSMRLFSKWLQTSRSSMRSDLTVSFEKLPSLATPRRSSKKRSFSCTYNFSFSGYFFIHLDLAMSLCSVLDSFCVVAFAALF
ncbi:hypothetical protein AAHE18_16G182800 [Arachis hypogaea]